MIIQATLFGLLFNMINAFSDRPAIRRKPLGKIILLKSVLYLIGIIFTELFVLLVFDLLGLGSFKNWSLYRSVPSLNFFISFFTYFVVSVLFINFFLQMNRKIGHDNMYKLLLGRYHKPHGEKRIFMFMDLKDSTKITEKLGHKTYSQFIRQCFHDLTDIILKYRAEIYQYVGDEVVLSWLEDKGFKNFSCIKTFYEFKRVLNQKHAFYLKTFNTFPEFHAGLDYGFVTVSEIGDLKREIAYHGDILNTAARLLGQCKPLGRDLLFSGNVYDKIKTNDGPEMELVGEVRLRGKKNPESIYTISQEIILD
jgi:adenylate cyclase